jgi:hypothetical protein
LTYVENCLAPLYAQISEMKMQLGESKAWLIMGNPVRLMYQLLMRPVIKLAMRLAKIANMQVALQVVTQVAIQRVFIQNLILNLYLSH